MPRLTILCENTAACMIGLHGEHGFSVLIEGIPDTTLFDTGQGLGLIANASVLKVDLGRVNRICLSHGHFDHTGGLAQALKATGSLPVYAHPALFTDRVAAIRKDQGTQYLAVGIPFTQSELESMGARFVFNTRFTEIARGLYLTGEIPKTTPFEKNDPQLLLRQGTELVPDPVSDDQSLVLDTTQGLVVVLGCAHSGLINTLKHVQAHFPGRPFHTVLGGTHLDFLEEAQLEATLQELATFSIERIGVSHCTGLGPASALKKVFGNAFFFAKAGSVLEIP